MNSGIRGDLPKEGPELDRYLIDVRNFATRMLMYHEMTHILQRAYMYVHTSDAEDRSSKLIYVFADKALADLESDEYLTVCYNRHQQQVANYFKGREQQLLTLDVADPNSPQLLQQFLNTQQPINFKQLNIGGKVTAWNDIKHPDKVSSTRSGKIDKSLGYNHT